MVWLGPTPFATAQTPTPAAEPAVALDAGKPLARELAGGGRHLYTVAVAAGQYLRVVVRQRGIDVVVRETSPGAAETETDFEPRTAADETIELTARESGAVTIAITPKQKNAAAGRYEIEVAEMRAAAPKDVALDEARRLLAEATRLWWLDKYDAALPLARRVVEIRERELGSEHTLTGAAVFMLANQYSDKGDYATAEPLYRRALAVREKAHGPEDIALAGILNNLGLLYNSRGDYPQAAATLSRALVIREKHLDSNHVLISNLLLNLGIVSRNRGDHVKASEYYTRVLEIREKTLGPDDPAVALALNNLANLYSDFVPPDRPKIEALYLRALGIREKKFEPNSPPVAETVYNLALFYATGGDLPKALEMSRRAYSIHRQTLGAEHPLTAMSGNLLGGVLLAAGDHAQAAELFQRSAQIRQQTAGEFHPYLSGVLSNLACVYALRGETEQALAAQSRANRVAEFNTALNLAVGSERQKIAYMRTQREMEDRTLSLGFGFAPASKEAAQLSASIVLQRKGRVLDAVSESLNALRRRFNEQDRVWLDSLNQINQQLTGLVGDESGRLTPEARQAKLKTLTDEREKIEHEISRRAGGFYQRSAPVAVSDVQPLIPAGAALVEYAVYRPVIFQNLLAEVERTPRIAVFVLRGDDLKWADLGEAPEIEARIAAFREALRDPKRGDAHALGRALDEKVMQPVRALAGDARHLLVSPDGELNMIPFGALVDEKNEYLVERYTFTYLTSGRDLLRFAQPAAAKNPPVIVANPVYGPPVASNAAGGRRGASPETFFAPLAGSAQEGAAIRGMFPEADLLTGAAATEAALKTKTAPRILHIATHGFFLGGAASREASKSETARGAAENPLIRAGLALAGANARKNGADDGILTALEASGLNLWGTRLVVLSACDTGVGESRNGDGVYGLRRAFVMAGAESLVMSLWPVSDYVTRELMTDYYRRLKTGRGRAAALREVQLALLRRPERRHPFYWASFIQSGEWANLDGKR